MSWRVVTITKRSKLDFKMGFLVVRNEEGEKRIHLDDISVLMCETTAISVTAYLLAEMVERKIKVIFCDNMHNPLAELMPMHGNYLSSGRIRAQISWTVEDKAKVWKNIVRAKIRQQANVLRKVGDFGKFSQLMEYAEQVEPGDPTNREGHAAKVYFNTLFGADFYRDSEDVRNAVLNYGYSVLLACFNREISACGYLTQLGIWHDSAENSFNLGSDLVESFRPIIDYFAYRMDFKVFEKEEKIKVLDLLNIKVGINNSEQYLNNAIGIYVRGVSTAMQDGAVNKIMNWYEL